MDNRFKIDSKESKILHLTSKSWLHVVIKKLFLKVLSKLSSEKSLFYKNKVIALKLKIKQSLFFLRAIFLRFKYPQYFLLPSKHIHAISVLVKFLKILKAQKIDFFLMDGSLLGAVRQESFAGRPKDVDLGIKEHQFSKLLDAVPLLIDHGVTYVKAQPSKKLEKLQMILDGVLIDVEFFRKRKKNGIEIWVGQTLDKSFGVNSFPIEDLENLVPVKIYGKTFMSPSNPEIFLEKRFGKNWKIPEKSQFFWKK